MTDPESAPQRSPAEANGRAGSQLPGAGPRRRAWLLGVGALAAGAGAGLAWYRLPVHNAVTASADAGAALAQLWALKAALPQGGELDLASLRGKPLLINFWATWCAPCVREMPLIDRFHREYAPRGWQVLGLAVDRPAPVNEFLGRVKVGFPIGMAGLDGMDLLRSLGNPQGGLPFTVVLSADGRLLQRKMGETSFDELTGWAAKA